MIAMQRLLYGFLQAIASTDDRVPVPGEEGAVIGRANALQWPF